jgi:hypothetical protein
VGVRPFVVNKNGVGMGLNYERYLDSSNNFSIYVPADILLSVINNNDVYINSIIYNTVPIEQYGFSVAPSFRIYFKEPRKFNWFLGIGLYYGQSYLRNSFYKLEERTIGNMVNFGFKATVKKKVTISLDMGTGLALYNKSDYTESSNPNNVLSSKKVQSIGSLNFQIGYNFKKHYCIIKNHLRLVFDTRA